MEGLLRLLLGGHAVPQIEIKNGEASFSAM